MEIEVLIGFQPGTTLEDMSKIISKSQLNLLPCYGGFNVGEAAPYIKDFMCVTVSTEYQWLDGQILDEFLENLGEAGCVRSIWLRPVKEDK